MKAVDCLREPGDAARRESDRAVAVLTHAKSNTPVCLHPPTSGGLHPIELWSIDDLPGDDWRPLHPAGELQYPESGYFEELTAEDWEQIRAIPRPATPKRYKRLPTRESTDHAAEVERLTAERDHWKANHDNQSKLRREQNAKWRNCEWDMRFRNVQLKRLSEENETLTARVAELEQLCNRLIWWGQPKRESVAERIWLEAMEQFHPSPLPTAGDDACEVNPIVSRMCERGTKCCTVEHAPAEPDCPAEEQPSKLRDESWLREAADAEDQHASVCAGDMTPRKPVCLDGVPAVLCETQCGYQVWAYGLVGSDGDVAAYNPCREGGVVDTFHVAELQPIHHDAAAVELAGRIAEGGGG